MKDERRLTTRGHGKKNGPFLLPRRFAATDVSRSITLGAAAVLFFLFCALPILYMIVVSLTDERGGVSVGNYERLLAEPKQREVFANSLMLGAGVATLAAVLGVPLGLALARVRLPVKGLVRLALLTPLLIPPYILALAWTYISGPAGLIAQSMGYDALSEWTYSLTGAVVVLGTNLYPLSMLATEAAARRIDVQLEEAALLAAPPRRVLWRITLPLIAPAIAASTLIVFVLALSEFGVPGLLRVRVFTTEIFTAFAALYNFGAATALSVPLLITAAVAGLAARGIIGSRSLTTSRGYHTAITTLPGRWRYFLIAGMTVVILASVISPLLALGLEARGFDRILTSTRDASAAIRNSLILSLVGATLIVSLGALLGYLRSRALGRWGAFADAVYIAVFAAPSAVVGVGIIGLYNRPGFFNEIYSGPVIIIVAYLARFVSVAALLLAGNVRQISISSEEAAEVAGAGWLRTFTRIVLPQMWPGLAVAWVMAFIFTFGELGVTVLVSPPGESTLPVRVYTLIANAPSSEVAALAFVQLCMTLLSLTLFAFLLRVGRADGSVAE